MRVHTQRPPPSCHLHNPAPPPTPALRVFLFVDPELVSASVCSALLLEIEAAQVTPEACMRHVVSHALQAALGEACHAGALHRKLQVTEPRLCTSTPITL